VIASFVMAKGCLYRLALNHLNRITNSVPSMGLFLETNPLRNLLQRLTLAMELNLHHQSSMYYQTFDETMTLPFVDAKQSVDQHWCWLTCLVTEVGQSQRGTAMTDQWCCQNQTLMMKENFPF
jgi:hypothetical protein